MAKAKKAAARTGLKWKRKKWYRIAAPRTFNNKIVGEAFAETPQSMLGRVVEVNLMQMTGNIKKQNLVLRMKVNDVKNEIAQTEVLEFYMQPASIKRLVRKGTTKIDESFCCHTNDKKLIRIKPLLLTRSKISSSISRDLRAKTRAWLTNAVSVLSYEQLINDLCSFRLQRDMKTVLDKIYPLKGCQVRNMKIETKQKVMILKPTGKDESAAEKKKFARKKKPEGKIEEKNEKAEEAKEAVKKIEKTEAKKAKEEKTETPKEKPEEI
ncbi:hypothetical protein KY325_04675 [Candidatus Woesearchaeota archaeon]|nr:hypothetical protein [Candidatus Woesearchaeota archaeon]MBW3018428.1 hypothetical protein [Candidatus Woesearchaeota archaeon]